MLTTIDDCTITSVELKVPKFPFPSYVHALHLEHALTIFKDNIKKPEVCNGGYTLDVFSPQDFYLKPGCHVKIKAGFGLNLPHGVTGIIAPKNSAQLAFSVSPGYTITPGFQKELDINLIYNGLNEEVIKKDDPLCQIVFVLGVGLIS